MVGSSLNGLKEVVDGQSDCSAVNGTRRHDCDDGDTDVAQFVLLGVGLLAAVVAVVITTVYARRELRKMGLEKPTEDGGGSEVSSDAEERRREPLVS